jgi:multiple sugar transport system substrate-binding protein
MRWYGECDLLFRAGLSICSKAMSFFGSSDHRIHCYFHVTAFAPVPKLHNDNQYITAGTGYLDYMSINSQSKQKEAAWKFLNWYVTEGNEPMIAGGRVPAWKKADPEKVVKMILGDHPEKLFDVESFKHVLFFNEEFIVDTKFDKMPEIQKIVEEESERAFIGEQSTEQAVANMKKRSDEVLKQK